ncbi:MAG: hypothetical protein M5U18_00560 [Dehalococcoidia bacterium]|nr:hypothetical protein [Dehalococcoidia bacterium]
MTHDENIDISSREFIRRVAASLRVARQRRRLTCGELAARSSGAYGAGTLEAFESGRRSLANVDLAPLARLYGIDLDALLQPRMSITVHPGGTLTAGAVAVGFDPANSDSLLLSYLRLVRDLRNQRREPVVALRREDVESLAAYLQEDGSTVLERLGKLMGFTRAQRRSMAILFAAGAAVIMAATTAFAVAPPASEPQTDNFDSGSRAWVLTASVDSDNSLPGFTVDGGPDSEPQGFASEGAAFQPGDSDDGEDPADDGEVPGEPEDPDDGQDPADDGEVPGELEDTADGEEPGADDPDSGEPEDSDEGEDLADDDQAPGEPGDSDDGEDPADDGEVPGEPGDSDDGEDPADDGEVPGELEDSDDGEDPGADDQDSGESEDAGDDEDPRGDAPGSGEPEDSDDGEEPGEDQAPASRGLR